MPLYLWGLRELRHNLGAVDALDALRSQIHNLWHIALSGAIDPCKTEHASRQIQDGIYIRRGTDPSLPGWVYRLHRPLYQRTMGKSAQDLVEEAIRARE